MTGLRRPGVGAVAFVLYVGTVVAANWFVQHVGQPTPGGGPHTIPVGFGYRAPSGVLWIGVAFTLRDVLQSTLGKRAAVVAILAGAGLSYLVVAPALATASAVAFLASETLDFAVYTPLADGGRVVAAVVLSNVVGLLLDTVVFLQLAFDSLDFWQGQVLGKLWMTAIAVVLVVPARHALRPAPG